MAQQQSPKQRLITFLVMYLLLFMGLQFILPKPTPPGQAQSVLEQARQLEKEGRTPAADVSKADRVKKLDQASQKYEQFYQANKNSPEGWQARFQSVNIYDYLATQLEGEKSGVHWLDQAMARLKDMETSLHGKSAEVQIETNGEVRTASGDLGQLSTQKLDQIRQLKDQRNSGKWTWQILDGLVKLAGGPRYPEFSYFAALLLVVVVLKGLTWPFQKKQYQYTQDMNRVAPLIKQAQEQMKDRPPEELNKRVFQIYRENNVNLAGGCLPMLVMMVVLFPVYWMVADYEYQFTNGKFLWIGSEFGKQVWWIADNLAQFDVPMFVIYLGSTMLYSLLQPKPADPQQAQQQKMMLYMMPAMFGIFMWMGKWSSAFMLYWLILNVVSMYQTWILMKRSPRTNEGPTGGGGGGTPAADPEPPKPAAPLEPMKGLKQQPKKHRPSERSQFPTPRQVRPRGVDRRG
jgi:YidC/Oxa1 family membrane protein insertase